MNHLTIKINQKNYVSTLFKQKSIKKILKVCEIKKNEDNTKIFMKS